MAKKLDIRILVPFCFYSQLYVKQHSIVLKMVSKWSPFHPKSGLKMVSNEDFFQSPN